MTSESKYIVHSWLRSGATATQRGCTEFLAETLARLPEGYRITLVRADSGFYSNEFLEFIESKGLQYLIAMPMNKWLTRFCAGLSEWTAIDSIQSLAVGHYQPERWRQPRSVIVIRKRVPARVMPSNHDPAQQSLISVPAYEYRALVTNLDNLCPREARDRYQQRGDCENRIKELKHDFHANGFCLHSFAGTEAVLRLNCFLFNLVAEFKRSILRDTRTTLGSIRTSVFVIGAALGSSARTKILRLGLAGRWRDEFERLLKRIANFSTSTAAQLQIYMNSNDYCAPSPWRLRKPRLAFIAF
jgi:hypothetical protein